MANGVHSHHTQNVQLLVDLETNDDHVAVIALLPSTEEIFVLGIVFKPEFAKSKNAQVCMD